MGKFLSENLKYPKDALENRIEGKVYLSYQVDQDGLVRDVEVRKGLGHGCDEEAVRVVSLMKFSPQKNRGSRVTIRRKLNITFKLPTPPKKASPVKRTIQYNYTMKEKSTQKTYTYSYKINKKV